MQEGGRDTEGKVNKVNVSGLVETGKQQSSGTVMPPAFRSPFAKIHVSVREKGCVMYYAHCM